MRNARALVALFFLAIVAVSGSATRADAQSTFGFSYSGPTSSGSIVLDAVFQATSGIGDRWTATTFISGSVNLNGGGPVALTGFGTASVSSKAINGEFFSPATSGFGSGIFDSFNNGVTASGLSFTTGTRDYMFMAVANDFAADAAPGTDTGAIVGGGTAVLSTPGPLAGAGMLSYLAVLLMGLALRGGWIVAQVRVWIERRRAPQLAQES